MPMEDNMLPARAPALDLTPSPQVSTPDTSHSRPSQSVQLVTLAEEVHLFHSPEGEPYATVTVNDHQETWRLRSRGFRRWLEYQFYQHEGRIPGSQVLQGTLGILEGKALFDAPEQAVFIRLAEHEGVIYLDLANAAWEVVEISANGWKVVQNAPVKFLRRRGMLPLPHPKAGGSLADLRSFVNVTSDADWHLLVAWLLAALRPCGPYPVLNLHGEQGSTKSTLARLLRALVDPNKAPLRAEPRQVQDVMIAATNAWMLAFDNLSHLPPWLSDAICRLATGGGFGTRELFTNQEEALFDAQRPVLLTGIDEVVTRGDLLDRSLLVYLPDVPEAKRRPEAEFWPAFEEVRPGILGALLDAVSAALRQLATVQVSPLPRMADFAIWVTAAAPTLGWEAQDFLDAYTSNREDANAVALESSAVAHAVHTLATGPDGWEGTATALLETLNAQAPLGRQNPRDWPKNARALSAVLRRLAPNLRAVGIAITFARDSDPLRTRRIVIREEKSENASS